MEKCDFNDISNAQKPIQQIEYDIIGWLSYKKNNITGSFTKEEFQRIIDEIENEYQETWPILINDILLQVKTSLKQLICNNITNDDNNRIIKPPLSFTEEQDMIQKVLSIRDENPECGPELKLTYDKTIAYLLKDLQNKINIEPELTPVEDLKPFLDKAWEIMINTYKKYIQTSDDIMLKLNQIYSNIEKKQISNTGIIKSPLFFNYVEKLAYILKIIDQTYWKNKINELLIIDNNIEKKNHIFNGPFEPFLKKCYAKHKKLLKVYFEEIFPDIVTSWVLEDVNSLMGKNYVEKIEQLINYFVKNNIPVLQKTIINLESLQSTTSLKLEQLLEHIIIVWCTLAIKYIHYNDNFDEIENNLKTISLQEIISSSIKSLSLS
jgi:hypothetical protein